MAAKKTATRRSTKKTGTAKTRSSFAKRTTVKKPYGKKAAKRKTKKNPGPKVTHTARKRPAAKAGKVAKKPVRQGPSSRGSHAASREHGGGFEKEYVAGDGGPLVVLQALAVPKWQGAADFDNSLMNGGTVETDYDVICDCKTNHLERYGRDMLVLNDSEWAGRMFALPSGDVVVVQHFYVSDELPSISERIAQYPPKRTFPMKVEDASLRLLVGADEGASPTRVYGHQDVAIAPGMKRCELHTFDDALAIVIRRLTG
jgi:hypothetical protein